jgi:hypothetical protein
MINGSKRLLFSTLTTLQGIKLVAARFAAKNLLQNFRESRGKKPFGLP